MVLSFDSGTTNTKAFLFDNNANLLASASHPTPIYHRGPGIVEQDAESWWESLVLAIEKLHKKIGWDPKDIEAIGVSSQGGTFVPLSKDITPLMSGITWLDNRGRSEAEQISQKEESNYFYLKTGHNLKGWSPPAVLKWISVNHPSVSQKIDRISFVADYINYKLTDRFFLDPTSAQMSCIYNINSGFWDEDILRISGLENKNLPELLNSNQVGGTVTKKVSQQINVLEGTPVVSGGHDQYCASLGAGATKSGDCLLSCGTAWVLLITSNKLTFLSKKGWTPGRNTQNKMFGLMSSIGNAGIILGWMRNNLKIDNFDTELPLNAEVIPDFSLGEGVIKNISLSTTGAEIYQATIKSLVMRLHNRLKDIEEVNPVHRLFMVGGATKEPLLPKMVKNLTGKEVVISDVLESAGKGAALLALNRT